MQSPSPLQLNEFLRSVSSGGPTAATSMHQAFKWFQHNMGVNFQVDHFLLSSFPFHAQGHTGAQAKEMEPWEMLNLIFMAKKASGTRLLVLAFVIQSAVSCIRFEHAQSQRWAPALSFLLEEAHKVKIDENEQLFQWGSTTRGRRRIAVLWSNSSCGRGSCSWPAGS